MRLENTFLPVEGVGPTTERRLWDAGVTHWEDFDGSVLGPTRGERISSFIDRGVKALDAGEIDFFDERLPSAEHWRYWRNFRDKAVAVDIETTGLDPDRAMVTTVTVRQGDDVRTLVRGDDLTGASLREVFDTAELLITYNGKQFDVPFLESAFDVDLNHPHLDCMYVARAAGLSGGLTEVERTLGLERRLPEVDGRDAVRLWHAHEAGHDGALERLIRYNQEDVRHLPTILDRAVERLTPEPFLDT
ncbi:MAG: ribonuclease H-like domain-containing protein [Salinirussus sp.]